MSLNHFILILIRDYLSISFLIFFLSSLISVVPEAYLSSYHT